MTRKRSRKRTRRLPGKKRVKTHPAPPAPTPTPAPDKNAIVIDDGLTLEQRAFAHAYDANGGNGTRAYREIYPGVSSDHVAASSAWRLLKNEKIAALINRLSTARFIRMQMSGDEALALTGASGRLDVGDVYDDDGKMLPVKLWPEHVRRCVTSIRPGPYGDAVTFEQRTPNRRIVLEATGKLKNPIAGAAASLARILAGDFDDEPD